MKGFGGFRQRSCQECRVHLPHWAIFTGTCLTTHIWAPCKKGSSSKSFRIPSKESLFSLWTKIKCRNTSNPPFFHIDILVTMAITSNAPAMPLGVVSPISIQLGALLFWHPWVASLSQIWLTPSWSPGCPLCWLHEHLWGFLVFCFSFLAPVHVLSLMFFIDEVVWHREIYMGFRIRLSGLLKKFLF